MNNLKTKLSSGSSMAGYALILQGISLAIASKGADINAWGLILGGVGAVLRD